MNSATTKVGIQTRKKLSDNDLGLWAGTADGVRPDGGEVMSAQFNRLGVDRADEARHFSLGRSRDARTVTIGIE